MFWLTAVIIRGMFQYNKIMFSLNIVGNNFSLKVFCRPSRCYTTHICRPYPVLHHSYLQSLPCVTPLISAVLAKSLLFSLCSGHFSPTVTHSLPPHPFSTFRPCHSSSPLSVSAHQTTFRCLAARHKPKL